MNTNLKTPTINDLTDKMKDSINGCINYLSVEYRTGDRWFITNSQVELLAYSLIASVNGGRYDDDWHVGTGGDWGQQVMERSGVPGLYNEYTRGTQRMQAAMKEAFSLAESIIRPAEAKIIADLNNQN